MKSQKLTLNQKLLSLFTFFLLFTICLQVNAQKRCNSNEFMEAQLKKHPELQAARIAMEAQANEAIPNKNSSNKKSRDLVTIPTIFHVLYNNSTENISKQQVLSQLTVLNNDFRRQNSDATSMWSGIADDTDIEFCLASIDPSGNFTDGINYISTFVPEFDPDAFFMFKANTGGVDIWSGYLNIIICNLGIFTNGVSGFAPFPGYNSNYDAVVLDYRVTGTVGSNLILNYDKGRTATHEVAHWLNLKHLWGDNENGGSCSQDDGVSDTRASKYPYTGCPTSGNSCGSNDMYNNFMEYVYDGCMNMFTSGQADRMHAAINVYRSSLRNHLKCADCLPSINVNKTISSATTIQSNNTITANNDVTGGCVEYRASNRIKLNSGFRVSSNSTGCRFSAHIQDCN